MRSDIWPVRCTHADTHVSRVTIRIRATVTLEKRDAILVANTERVEIWIRPAGACPKEDIQQ